MTRADAVIAPADDLWLRLDRDKLCWFDPESWRQLACAFGCRIDANGEGR